MLPVLQVSQNCHIEQCCQAWRKFSSAVLRKSPIYLGFLLWQLVTVCESLFGFVNQTCDGKMDLATLSFKKVEVWQSTQVDISFRRQPATPTDAKVNQLDLKITFFHLHPFLVGVKPPSVWCANPLTLHYIRYFLQFPDSNPRCPAMKREYLLTSNSSLEIESWLV